jgi:3-oxoacyl-[acyl-carrier-protein] synthase-1
VLTPLASGIEAHYDAIQSGQTGLQMRPWNSEETPYCLSSFRTDEIDFFKKKHQVQTRFDALLLEGLANLVQDSSVDFSDGNTGILLASTKGNIELLEISPNHEEEIPLHQSALRIQQFLNNPNEVQVVSNACISGISALIVAKRWIEFGQFKQVLVIGCDVISNFILKGFQSFKALDKQPCKPFDVERNGLNLGEAFTAMLLSSEHTSEFIFKGGLITNDSNHISGPSKTGEELGTCIQHCCHLAPDQPIDFIAAHGTATPYNDEMEAKAIFGSGLNTTPVFSLKAIFGHTLGAAGLLETAMACCFLKENKIPPSFGYTMHGVSSPIRISSEWLSAKPLHRFIKTGSGFGGCNAAILVEKVLNK